ncbi:MAG: dihydrolipoamide acetyltransferase family protein [Verrucomicrobiales bacterium]
MPKLSDTMTEGTLVRWLKKDGDLIEISEVIAEIETDKAVMEMESFDQGRLQIYTREGEKIAVGGAIGYIVAEGETAPESPPSPSPLVNVVSSSPPTLSEISWGAAEAPAQPLPTAPTAPPPGPLRASPVAVKLAAARGVDLASLRGSGPGGRIIKRDVLGEAAPAPGPGETAAPAAPAPARGPLSLSPSAEMTPSPETGATRLPLSAMRAVIAERLLASKTTIPHFYLTIEVDAAPLMTLRKQLNSIAESATGDARPSNKYTLNDFILAAAAGSAMAVPAVNASFDGDAILQFPSVHLAVAVGVEGGLVTPVLRDAQEMSILTLSMAVKDLARRAREKRLTPNEFAGGTLTVSNLGAWGIEAFDAIINPPQAAILSIGAVAHVPVVGAEGEIVAGQRIKVGMSCDHRVVDGAIAAEYLADFKKRLENPAIMLI